MHTLGEILWYIFIGAVAAQIIVWVVMGIGFILVGIHWAIISSARLLVDSGRKLPE